MKKALSLLLLAFPLWLGAQSYYQSLVVHTDLPSNVQKSIIKELHFPASISYVETSAEHYFVYHDGTINPLSIVRIHPGLNVKDFEIADDSVFFCGTNAAGEGFFGHFDINSFFQMQHSYSVTDFTFQLLTGSVVTVGTVADMQFLTAHNPAIDVFTVSSGSGQSFTVYFGQSVTMVNGVDCTE